MTSRERTTRPARAFLLACLLLPAALPARLAAELALPFLGGPDRIEVTVRERPAAELWEVTVHLPRAAAGVDLPHGRGTYRRAAWGLAPPGSTWVDAPPTADGTTTERLCFAQPLRDFAVTFRADYATRPKDHELNVAMSDGGRLLDTGHVVVQPLATCAAGAAAVPAAAPTLYRFRLTTDAGRTIRVGDRAATGALTWEPAAGQEETYAYFGPQAAAPGERVALVADPQLPAWIRNGLEAQIAALLDRFAAETGTALPARPLVFLGYDPKGSGSSLDGGVLGNVVTLAARGEGWAQQSDAQRRLWTIRLAHEIFHLWDGGAFHPDAESEWLSEAAAEAFALRAAWGTGVLPTDELARTTVDLANQCLADLGGGPLITAGQRGAWHGWYTCGPVLLWAADRAVERAHPGQGGLGLLFRSMLAEAAPAGHTYGTGVFLGWLDKLSGDRDTVFAIQRLVRQGAPKGADTALLALLTHGGLRVTLADPAAAQPSAEVSYALLRAGLVRCACGGAAPEPGSDCARLAGGEPVTKVGDVERRRDPAGAYAHFRAAATFGRPLRVTLGDDAQPLTLFCGRDALDPSFGRLLRLAP